MEFISEPMKLRALSSTALHFLYSCTENQVHECSNQVSQN